MIVALLLAMMAAPGAEGAAFPISAFSCLQDGEACPGGATIVPLPEVNGLAGVKMYLNEPAVFAMCGQYECSEQESRLEFVVEGRMSGDLPAGTMFPVSWDVLLDGEGAEVLQWELQVRIYDEATGRLSSWGDNGTGYHIVGSRNLTSFGLEDGELFILGATLEVIWAGDPDAILTIDVPANSIDFGAAAAPSADVPEPGSLALAGCGLAALVILRRRRERIGSDSVLVSTGATVDRLSP